MWYPFMTDLQSPGMQAGGLGALPVPRRQWVFEALVEIAEGAGGDVPHRDL
jgi:hypothetical protein